MKELDDLAERYRVEEEALLAETARIRPDLEKIRDIAMRLRAIASEAIATARALECVEISKRKI